MSIRGYRITIAMLLIFVGSPSYGQSPSCYDPMEVPGTCLPWGYTDLQQQMGSHIATDISKDGSAVATVNSPPGFGLVELPHFRGQFDQADFSVSSYSTGDR